MQRGKNRMVFKWIISINTDSLRNIVHSGIHYFVSLIAITLVMLFFGSLIENAQAANWYVRPSGGLGSGTNWNTAWNGFSSINWSTVSCGDTIWVAGGTYTQNLTPNKQCTAGSRLNIRRARSDATECTSAPGWISSYNSIVYQYRKSIDLSGIDMSYVTISGRTTAAGVEGYYGWVIDYDGTTTGNGVYYGNQHIYDYNTLEYIEFAGPASSQQVTFTGADSRGIDFSALHDTHKQTGNVFSHLKIHGWGTAAYDAYAQYSIWEYLDVYDIEPLNSSTYHPNAIYITQSNHSIVRYSKFHWGLYAGVGEGIFFAMYDAKDDWQIYGNIFYDLTQTGRKAIEVRDSVTMTNLRIYNNTFVNVRYPILISGVCSTGSETKNNLNYRTSGLSPGTMSYCGSTSNNLEILSPDPFISLANKYYHIVSTIGTYYPRNAGTSLSTYFAVDRDGKPFGGDGAWDIGAYEYSLGSTTSLVPEAPTAININ